MLRFSKRMRVQKIGTRQGQTLHYAKQLPGTRMTLAMVEERIVQATALSRGDVRASIRALADAVNDALLLGMSVDLGDLGSFRVVASGACMDTAEEVTAKTIRRPRIRYYPKREMVGKALAVAITIDDDATATCPAPGAAASAPGSTPGGSSTPGAPSGGGSSFDGH